MYMCIRSSLWKTNCYRNMVRRAIHTLDMYIYIPSNWKGLLWIERIWNRFSNIVIAFKKIFFFSFLLLWLLFSVFYELWVWFWEFLVCKMDIDCGWVWTGYMNGLVWTILFLILNRTRFDHLSCNLNQKYINIIINIIKNSLNYSIHVPPHTPPNDVPILHPLN